MLCQVVDVGCGVSGLWGDLQSPCPFWRSWLVDQLDVDAVIYHQSVGKIFILYRITNHHRNGVAEVGGAAVSQVGAKLCNLVLLDQPFNTTFLEVLDGGRST